MKRSLFLLFALIAPAAAAPGDRLLPGDALAELAGRRAALAERLGEGTFVLLPGPEAGYRDEPAEPNLYWLTGLEQPAALVLTVLPPPGRGARTVLYLPPPRPGRARWTGPELAADESGRAGTGADEVLPLGRLAADLAALPAGTVVWTLPRRPVAERYRETAAALAAGSPRDAGPHVAGLRAVKSPEEVARIRRACELTAGGLVDAMRACRPGMPEYELQAVLEFACRRGGAPRQAFASIVASGPNTLVLHYSVNRRTVAAGDLVLMDVGGEVLSYAADVTRTFPASGRFTERQGKVYDTVLAAQAAGIAAVRPGATLGDVDKAARKVIADAGFGGAFPHSTSHHVGLEVHDPVRAAALGPGMVITVEPGVYLEAEGFGIRIEDTVLVTEEGAEVLSAGAPKARREIEALVGRSKPR